MAGQNKTISPDDKTVAILTNPDKKLSEVVERKLRELKPLHVRIREYDEARKRILGEVSNRVRRARKRFKKRKRIRKEIVAATLYEGEDSRFYTRIRINGEELEGLLDSGSTVTCLGKGCEALSIKSV